MWHIIPIGDIKEHIHDSTCPCKPRIIEPNGQMIANHNSFDGREAIERFNTKHGFKQNSETKWALYK